MELLYAMKDIKENYVRRKNVKTVIEVRECVMKENVFASIHSQEKIVI